MIPHFIFIITFSILFQLFAEVKSQTTLNLDLREAHTATFINHKLYILGGVIPNSVKSPKETFLFLDFSVPFNTDELKWNVLLALNNNVIPPHYFAAAIKGGANNDTLFLYGGESLSNQTMNLVYMCDTQYNAWSIPIITGIPPTRKSFITPIIDDKGLIYLYSGLTSLTGGNYTNDMLILDSINLSFSRANPINLPGPPRNEYGAVFLPDKNIIYIGGYNEDFGRFPLETVYLYDTTKDNWANRTTGGLIPSARSSFSSVLGLDGRKVIIFGGLENGATNISPEKSLYVLDLNNFNWSIPTTTGKIPSNRAFHKSVSIGKYMVVTFGEGYLQEGESDVLLLDISNDDGYIWTSSFEPLPYLPSPTSSSPTTTPTEYISSDNIYKITTIVLSVFLGTLIICTGTYYWHYYAKKRSDESYITYRPRPDPQYNTRTNSFRWFID